MTDHWFKPKTHGYGAYPTSWKGWLLIAAFGVLQMLLAIGLLVPPARAGQPVDLAQITTFLLGTAVLTAIFLWLCKRKTDGEWRWRWPRSGN